MKEFYLQNKRDSPYGKIVDCRGQISNYRRTRMLRLTLARQNGSEQNW